MLNYSSIAIEENFTDVKPTSLSNRAGRISILYIAEHQSPLRAELEHEQYIVTTASTSQAFKLINTLGENDSPEIILVSADLIEDYPGDLMARIQRLSKQYAIPFILYSSKFHIHARRFAARMGYDDYYVGNFTEAFFKRASFIGKLKRYKNDRGSANASAPNRKMKIWKMKRLFDIIVSATLLLALSPIMLVIALIIKLESKGPIFFIAKRAGNGYKIFDFYKFRSMRNGAANELKELAHLNQYQDAVFYKIKNDPRVTRFGGFLRNTSLDELPQLINVLKGDMSLVGNRPLPLYEAEKLTKDQIAWRFLAPAGITGLWQITKRGKDNMSEEERIQLDMQYAMNNSFLFDMRILINTVPALFQKEKV